MALKRPQFAPTFTSAKTNPTNYLQAFGGFNMMQTVQANQTSSVNPAGPSMERRQRRVLALVEHMALIDQLINIFEQGGGTCDLRNGTKVFPWTTLPAQLAAKQLYFTGWPECCLPRPSGIHRNAVDPASDPMWWSAEQRAAMRAQIDARQIILCRRTPQQPGEAPFIFEFVDIQGAVRRTLVGFSTKWYHRMGRPGSGSLLSASTSPMDGDSAQPEFIPSTSFLDTYFHSLGSHDAPVSASSPSPPAVKQEGDDEMAVAESTSTATSIRTLPQHLESRLRRLLDGIPNKVLGGKRRRASSSHSSRAHSHRDGAGDGEKENTIREWARAGQMEERPIKRRRGEHPGSSSSSSLEEANVNYSPAPSLHVSPYHLQPSADLHALSRGRDPLSRKKISTQPRKAISARIMHGPSPTPTPPSLFLHQGESHSMPSLSHSTSLSPAHALPSQPTLARSIHQRHQRFNSGSSPAGYIPPRDHGVDVLPISPFSPAQTHSPFSPVPSQASFTPALSQSPSFPSLFPEDASR